MRKQDFINFDELKFRVSFDGEIVTTQESIDEFAIEFLNWYAMYGSWIEENLTSKELLEIYKKTL
jgi:hypothetical protein